MARKWIVAAAAVLALFAASYFGSPYWAARELRSAAMSGDVDRIEAAVDFPAVRESLRGQLTVALTEKMNNAPELKDNPFAGLGMMLMPTIVQKAVESYVTPDGIAAIVQRGEVKKDGAPSPSLTYDYDWRGLDRFAVTIRPEKVAADRAPVIVFERRGTFTWKMIRLQLPKDVLKGT